MKNVISLLIVVSIIGLGVGCKNKKSENKKAKVEVKSKVETKKKIKTDPLKIIMKSPNGVSTKTVIDNYFKVIGGMSNVKKVKTFCKHYDAKSAGVTFPSITRYALPNKINEFVVDKKGAFVSSMFFDGKIGGENHDGEISDFTAQDIEELFDKTTNVIFPDMDYYTGKLMGIAEVKGEKAYVINYNYSNIYYSVDSGLKILRIELRENKDNTKMLITSEEYYDDYREVSGIKFPFNVYVKYPGVAGVRFKINEIYVNDKVSNNDFKKNSITK